MKLSWWPQAILTKSHWKALWLMLRMKRPWVWRHPYVIPMTGRLRQEDHQFDNSLSYIAKPCPLFRKKEKGRGSSVLLNPLKMEAWPCFLPSWSCNLSVNNEKQNCKVGLLTLELENISPAYLQHQWPKADLAELISRETNQLEKMQICFLHRVGNSLRWTTPWIKFRAALRIWVR